MVADTHLLATPNAKRHSLNECCMLDADSHHAPRIATAVSTDCATLTPAPDEQQPPRLYAARTPKVAQFERSSWHPEVSRCNALSPGRHSLVATPGAA